MRVLFISANREQLSMPAIPLGLACVAEATKNAGHDVVLLDMMFEEDAAALLRSTIAEFQPECIGISIRNIDDQQMESTKFLLEKIKEVVSVCRDASSAPIVLGGAGYSIFPDSVLAYLDADMGIEGEGEIAFPTLLSQLGNGLGISEIPGLHLPGSSRRNSTAFSKSLDALPLPEPSALSASTSKNPDPWIPVQTRRGCPFNCSYCSTSTIEGAALRKRSPELVAAWLEKWVMAGYTNFYFVDNTFNLPAEYAKELCRQILNKGLDICWWCIVYPKNVDAELVELMAKAGCRQISLGFESGSEQILKNFNKRFSLDDIRISSALFAEYGIERVGFLLLGGPGETIESVEESLVFADSLNLDALKLTAGIRIYPDTQLAEVAENRGYINSQDDLLSPHFFIEPKIERWLPERLKEWAASRPNVML